VPVLAFVGGADPQGPLENLSDLKQHFSLSRRPTPGPAAA